ncbi:C-X-C chemokine receptor type 3 [Misgurnus anguillicaudatus]|uniref:C-X-C chemokine receptor type 3 n=1 Tax=Misgurnus anguillicaudatus TaxID=75329 RepID=UPI003CCF972B
MDVDLHGLWENNTTFDYDDYVYTDVDSQPCQFCGFVTVFIPLLYSVGLLWGLLGNGLVLLILWSKRRKWSVMDIFILHLGVADVLLMLTLPLWAVDAVRGWIIGTGFCKLAGALFKMNLYCCIFILALIGLERYLSSVRGVEMFSRNNPSVVHLSCVIVWFISLLLSIPDWIYLEAIMDETTPEKWQCNHVYPNNGMRISIRLLLLAVGVILPALVLLFCSILLYVRRKTSGPRDRRTCVFVALGLACIVGWTPYNVAFVVDTVSTSTASKWCEGKRWTAVDATAVLGLIHCVVKPVIYLCFSKEFQRRAMSLVKSKCFDEDSNEVSLWDCGEGSGCAGVQQEEQNSLHPMNDINQTAQDQNV